MGEEEGRATGTSVNSQGQASSERVLSEITAALSELMGFSSEVLNGDMLIEDLGLDSLSALKLLSPYQNGSSKIQAHDLFKYESLTELAEAIVSLGIDDLPLSQRTNQSPQSKSAHPEMDNNGMSIQWMSYGDGLNVIILAPPLNMSEDAWVQQINALTQTGRRVLIPIYPGHNGSVFVEEQFSLTWLADQFAVFVDQELQNVAVDLVGWSLGGCLCSLFVIKYPERVRSLTLISTAASFSDDVFGNILDLHNELREHKDILDVIYDGEEDIVSSMGAGTPMTVLRHYYEALTQFDIRTRLPKVSIRTLLVHGQNDCVVDDTAFQCLTVIPQTRQLRVEGHGHFIPLTSSRLFNMTLIRFLDEVSV